MSLVRSALWPARWPLIVLQECIDKVEAVEQSEQAQVAFALPCATCPEAGRCLNAKRKEIGALMYDRELLTKPRSSESSLFPIELFEPMLRREEALVPYYQKPFGVEDRFAIAQSWDLAWSEKIGGDWLVCETAVLDRQTGERRMLDIQRWQRLTFGQQVTLMEEMWSKYLADLVVIESDAAQQVWSQHMGRNTAVPVIPHDSDKKHDFKSGVPGLLLLLERKKWVFPYEQGTWHHDEMDVFLGEMEAFGWVDGKLQGIGEHDDTVMCFWHLNWALDRLSAPAESRQQRRGVQTGKYI